MKRIKLIVAALLAISLAACGSGKQPSDGKQTPQTDNPPVVTDEVGGDETEVSPNEIWTTDTTQSAPVGEPSDATVNPVPTPPSEPVPSPISSISLSYYDAEMEIGDEYMPIVTMYPEDAPDKSEIWTSSDTSVAKVDELGNITALSEGYTTVKVASAANPKVFASVHVHVTDPDNDYDGDHIHSIYLTDYNFTMDVGDTEMPYVTMYPSWADDFGEKWTSSDPSVASVDSKGNITALAPGCTTVIVTSTDNDDVFASVSVRVRGDLFMGGGSAGGAPAGNVDFDDDFETIGDEPGDGGSSEGGDGSVRQINLTFYTANMEIGGSIQPIVSMYPDDAEDKGEIWSSSDETVAKVDEFGNITATGIGDCVITVQSRSNPNVEANVSVRVKASATEPTYIEGIIVANKTYELPSDYNPQINPEAQQAFDDMAAAAMADGVTLFVVSGYRSYDYQSTVYDNYVATYGQEAADRFSARPGHSEHQTGLAFDVNTVDDAFAQTEEYKWLEQHCVEYGFIIRYPDGKESITGYKFEPWHIRYLGKETAAEVAATGLTLEEYLGITSKYSE